MKYTSINNQISKSEALAVLSVENFESTLFGLHSFLENLSKSFNFEGHDIQKIEGGFMFHANDIEVRIMQNVTDDYQFRYQAYVRMFKADVICDNWDIIKSRFFEYPIADNLYFFMSPEFDVCDAESNKMILNDIKHLVNFQANALDLYELRCDNIIIDSIIKKIAGAVASGILVNKELLDSDSTLLEELLMSIPTIVILFLIFDKVEKLLFYFKTRKIDSQDNDL